MNYEKNFKKAVLLIILSIFVAAAIFISLLFKSKENYSDSYFYSMDTFVEIVGDSKIKKDIKDIISNTEKTFSFHDPDSELSNLNKNGFADTSENLTNAISRIIELNKKYGNSADITIGAITSLWNITGNEPRVPSDSEIRSALKSVGFENIKINGNTVSLENDSLIDFGCAAKGAALDYVKEMLDNKNSDKTIVSIGGSSILLYGDDSFTTSILSPESNDTIGSIHTASGFISTSGGYHRYAVIDGKEYIHILDTKTGMPSETDLTSVTVFCQSGIDSDFISTMIFADGTENIEKYLKSEEFEIVAVDKDKNIYVSDDLDFELTDDSYKTV